MAELRGIDKLNQPKLKSLWVMSVKFGSDEGDAIDAYLVKVSARPHFKSDEVVIPYLNLERKFKGRSHWETLTVELNDPIASPAAKKVWQWILKHHDPVTGMEGYKDTYAVQIVNLKLLSPVGTTIEEWELHNVWISDADFQDLNYTSADPVGIALTLTYDWAELISTL